MEFSDKNNVPVDLIARFLNGEADTNDIIDLETWKASSGENQKVFEEYSRIWERTGQLSLFADIDIENEWNVFLESVGQGEEMASKQKKVFTQTILFRVAAALVAGVIVGYSGWFAYRGLKFERVVANNQVKEINLPDGSRVSLNRDSKIIYPKDFITNRKVEAEGVVFFQVQKDTEHPFTVNTGAMIVEVVGTSFQVDAPENNEILQVVVKSGVVAVYREDSETDEKNLVRQGERFLYSINSGIGSIQTNSDPNFDSWRTGIIEFDNSSLQYAVRLLEKLYHTEITLINPMLNQCRITVSFNNATLEYILETIAATLYLELLKTEVGYLLDGEDC